MGTHGPRAAAQGGLRLTEPPRRRADLYGRRIGRPLSGRQHSLFDTLLPKIALPEGPLDLAQLFPGARAFAFEVGFGGGEHLAALARANPGIGYIGCEPFQNGVAKLLTTVDAEGLSNVRIHMNDARDVLPRLPASSLSAAYVLFPDPWPKFRHAKRRFVQEATLDQLWRVLKPTCEFRVATDDDGYKTWALMQLMRDTRFRWTAEGADDWRVRPADWPATRYEAKALAAGRTPVYLRFVRL